MKIKITGKDRGDLLPISTDLQFLPVLTCNQESLGERDLLEAYRGAGWNQRISHYPPNYEQYCKKKILILVFLVPLTIFLKHIIWN